MAMDYHLDTLLNLPNLTVENCTQEGQQFFLKLRFFKETSDCPLCQNPSNKLHQNRPVLIRDLPISGQFVHLHLPRRQFYCSLCQRDFTERLKSWRELIIS
jgi:transposase